MTKFHNIGQGDKILCTNIRDVRQFSFNDNQILIQFNELCFETQVNLNCQKPFCFLVCQNSNQNAIWHIYIMIFQEIRINY